MNSEQNIEMPKIVGDRDIYCWKCHFYVISHPIIQCQNCVRVYHKKCALFLNFKTQPWTCLECVDSKESETQRINCKRLSTLLSFVITRMELCDGNEHFLNDVDKREYPDYLDYIIKPMCINTIKGMVKNNYYKNPASFLSDIKWLYHNSCIYNSKTAELTTIARRLVHVVKQELREIENCCDCYQNANTITDTNWFIQPCFEPHLLVWAKLYGFPFWPAKVIKADTSITVRFFGDHNSSKIQPNQCFLYSKLSPSTQQRVRLNPNRLRDLRKAIVEANDHIIQLRKRGIKFVYADKNTVLNIKKIEEQRNFMLVNMKTTAIINLEEDISQESPKVNEKSETRTKRPIKRILRNKVKNDILVNNSRKRRRSMRNIASKKLAMTKASVENDSTKLDVQPTMDKTMDKTEIIVIDSDSEGENRETKSTEDFFNKISEEYNNNPLEIMDASSDEDELTSFKIDSVDYTNNKPKIKVRKDVIMNTLEPINISLSPVESIGDKIEKVKAKIEALGYLPGNVKEIIKEFKSAFQLHDSDQYLITADQIRQLQLSADCILCLNKKNDKDSTKSDNYVNSTIKILSPTKPIEMEVPPLAPVSKNTQNMYTMTTVRVLDSNNKERLETRCVPLSNCLTITKKDIKNNTSATVRVSSSLQVADNRLITNSVNLIPKVMVNSVCVPNRVSNTSVYENTTKPVNSVFLRPTVTIQRVPQKK